MRYRILIVIFVLTAVSLSGTPSDQPMSSIWMFLSSGKTEESEDIRSIVVVELTREMKNRGFAIIPEQTWRAKLSEEELSSLKLMDSSLAIQIALAVEADITLIGSIEVEGKDIDIRIQAYDVRSNVLIFSSTEKESKDIGIYNRVSSLSRELIDALMSWSESYPGGITQLPSTTTIPEGELSEQQLRKIPQPERERVPELEALSREKPMEVPSPDKGEPSTVERESGLAAKDQRPVPKEVKVLVTLLSDDEGADVYLMPDQRAGTIEHGKLVIAVPGNIILAIETKKPGYQANREYFELKDQPVEIRLRPLLKTTRFGLELFSTSSQFLGFGAGFRFYIVPDYLLLRTDNYVYFSTISEGDDSPFAFHDDFRFQIGSYLFVPPNRRVRFGIATGIGLILSVLSETKTQPENSGYFDFYWDMINLWVDLNWNKWAVFFRVETKYALGIGASLLEPGFLADYGPQFTIGWLRKF